MTLTTWGKRFLGAVILLLGVGLLFRDVFLLIPSVAAFAFLFYDMYDSRDTARHPREVMSLSSSRFEARLLRGDSASFRARLACRRRVALDFAETPWVKPEPSTFEPGDWPITLSCAPELSGLYSSDRLPATVTSRYGLFNTKVDFDLSLSVRCYPRFMEAAIEVAELLLKSRSGTEGESESEIIGPGLEYAETRPYQPGDSLRRIDWKATARFSSLMVKQFHREGGGTVNFVYFLESPGPKTHDEVATQFLRLLVSAAREGARVSVTVCGQVTEFVHFAGNAEQVLASSLSLVFKSRGVTYEDLYSVLDVVPITPERKALLRAGKGKLAEILERTGSMKIGRVRGVRDLVVGMTRAGGSSSFIILDSLAFRNLILPELVDELRSRGYPVTIQYPTDPWVDALGLDRAYLMRERQEKLLDFAMVEGCQVVPMASKSLMLAVTPQLS